MKKVYLKPSLMRLYTETLLEAKISWLQKEFHDFNTLSDIDIYNVDKTLRQLGISTY